MIDIEQPAFVSPQHVVAIQVSVQGLCSDTVHHTFATKLHVRYPPLSLMWVNKVLYFQHPSWFLLGVHLPLLDNTIYYRLMTLRGNHQSLSVWQLDTKEIIIGSA